MMTSEFCSTITEEFDTGILRAMTLTRLTFEHGGATIEFSASNPFPGRFRIHVPLPSRPHDRLWDLFDDLTSDITEWTRWGVAVPLAEAYETQALSSPRDEAGIVSLRMP
ncbi:hypothetical protein [uncultured Microbacterium sp.]|uniref:hypothetical protein n=1 Tax=uncultured Microbacterium sp. TaxID=191216 RepID=UPI0025F5059F|nr:hypothetical protein [uncultured Microbacterium sp.]